MTKDTTFFRRLGVLLLLAAVNVSAAMAADVYNSANNQLSIASVDVSGTTYTDVVVTVGTVLSVAWGAPIGAYDSYNSALNQLTIPSVQVGNLIYTNVVITVGQVLRVGGIDDDEATSALLAVVTIVN
jgi:uncharacterized secreted protein with C-terminal beta-propeller domain